MISAARDSDFELLFELFPRFHRQFAGPHHRLLAVIVRGNRFDGAGGLARDTVQADVKSRRPRFIEHVPCLVTGHAQLDRRTHQGHAEQVHAAGQPQGADLISARVRPPDGQSQLLGDLQVQPPLVGKILREGRADGHADQVQVSPRNGEHRLGDGVAFAAPARHFRREIMKRGAPRPVQDADAKADLT
jgi:hypothetical protein